MKKVIRFLTVGSAMVMGLSAVAMWGCCEYAQELASWLLGSYAARALAEQHTVPVASLLYILGMLGATVALCFVAGNPRVGAWADILLAGTIAAVIPGMRGLVGRICGILLATESVYANTSYTVMESLCGYALSLTGIAAAAALIACGMSIAMKKSPRNQPEAM